MINAEFENYCSRRFCLARDQVAGIVQLAETLAQQHPYELHTIQRVLVGLLKGNVWYEAFELLSDQQWAGLLYHFNQQPFTATWNDFDYDLPSRRTVIYRWRMPHQDYIKHYGNAFWVVVHDFESVRLLYSDIYTGVPAWHSSVIR